MKRTRVTAVSVVVSLLWMVLPGRAAAPILIAIGTISGMFEDFATETPAPLENNVAGNRLGGMGSGLADMGGNLLPGAAGPGTERGAVQPLTRTTQVVHQPLPLCT